MEKLWEYSEVEKDKVLVIDDDPMIQDIASQIIKFAGFESLVASDWKEWIELYRKHVSSIVWVLLDNKIEKANWEIDKWENVLRQILEINEKARVIICSWKVFQSELESKFKWALGIIQKPLNVVNTINYIKEKFWE